MAWSQFFIGFPDGSVDKEFPCKAGGTGVTGSIPEWGRWQPTSIFSAKKIQSTEEPGRLQSVGLQSQIQLSDKA